MYREFLKAKISIVKDGKELFTKEIEKVGNPPLGKINDFVNDFLLDIAKSSAAGAVLSGTENSHPPINISISIGEDYPDLPFTLENLGATEWDEDDHNINVEDSFRTYYLAAEGELMMDLRPSIIMLFLSSIEEHIES